MPTYTRPEQSASPWQSASWRDNALEPLPGPEIQFILICNSGTSLPLRRIFSNGFQQFSTVDESSSIQVKIPDRSSRNITDQPYRHTGSNKFEEHVSAMIPTATTLIKSPYKEDVQVGLFVAFHKD
jgi:hypothetical protein